MFFSYREKGSLFSHLVVVVVVVVVLEQKQGIGGGKREPDSNVTHHCRGAR